MHSVHRFRIAPLSAVAHCCIELFCTILVYDIIPYSVFSLICALDVGEGWKRVSGGGSGSGSGSVGVCVRSRRRYLEHGGKRIIHTRYLVLLYMYKVKIVLGISCSCYVPGSYYFRRWIKYSHHVPVLGVQQYMIRLVYI